MDKGHDAASESAEIQDQLDTAMRDVPSCNHCGKPKELEEHSHCTACRAVAEEAGVSDEAYWAQVEEEVAKQRALNPVCLNCEKHTQKRTVMEANRCGNGGRTYYWCDTCHRFLTFADDRGVLEDGQTCYCNGEGKGGKRLARLQVSGHRRGRANKGKLHWVCATKECKYYELYVDLKGEERQLDDDEVARWIEKGML